MTITANAWFPAFRICAVKPLPLQKYVKITFIHKNSVAYVKNNVLRYRKFAVAVHPFILFFRICRSYRPAAPPTLLRRKLGAFFSRPAPGVLGLPRYYRAQASAATAWTACTDTVFTETVRQRTQNAGNQA